jgi:hypothetical protein
MKGMTLMTNGNYNEVSNHERTLELREDNTSGMKQIKKARNRRRNLRKKIVKL